MTHNLSICCKRKAKKMLKTVLKNKLVESSGIESSEIILLLYLFHYHLFHYYIYVNLCKLLY